MDIFSAHSVSVVFALEYPYRQRQLDYTSCKLPQSMQYCITHKWGCLYAHIADTGYSDSFPRQSTEVFILQMMLKNFLFYAFSNFINTWAATDGAGAVFRVFGIVSLVLLGLCIPMCELVPFPSKQETGKFFLFVFLLKPIMKSVLFDAKS